MTRHGKKKNEKKLEEEFGVPINGMTFDTIFNEGKKIKRMLVDQKRMRITESAILVNSLGGIHTIDISSKGHIIRRITFKSEVFEEFKKNSEV